MSMTVDQVMTREPKSVKADALAGAVLQLVNAAAITTVMVVGDDRRPVGIVHMHDLLRLGAA